MGESVTAEHTHQTTGISVGIWKQLSSNWGINAKMCKQELSKPSRTCYKLYINKIQ